MVAVWFWSMVVELVGDGDDGYDACLVVVGWGWEGGELLAMVRGVIGMMRE